MAIIQSNPYAPAAQPELRGEEAASRQAPLQGGQFQGERVVLASAALSWALDFEAGGGRVVGALPDASSSRYYAEYLEKRDLFGISFNTSIGGDSLFNGLSLAGELSYRPDTPIALGLNEYLPTALLNPDGLPVGTRLDGYREKDMFQASLAAIYNFNGLLGSDSAALFSELVASRVQGLESDVDYYEATSSAYGAQASLQLTYTNVFNLVNLVPSVSYQYSINGVAPQLTNGLDEEAQSWSVGLDAIYQESLTVGAKYVGYSGGGISNKRTDRDYLTFNVKYSF